MTLEQQWLACCQQAREAGIAWNRARKNETRAQRESEYWALIQKANELYQAWQTEKELAAHRDDETSWLLA